MDSLVDTFASDGFVRLPSFFDPAELLQICNAMQDYIEHVVPTMPREQVFYERKDEIDTLKQLQNLFDYDPFFHQLMFGGRVEELAARLLGEPVVGKNLQYFNKPAKASKPTPPHQDGFYFMLEPNSAVTMWVALEDVDEENGCVCYARGSQQDGLRPHGRTQTLGFSQGLSDFGAEDESRAVRVPAKAGDLLAHHALTVHWADANRSEHRSRRALGFVYYAAAARESGQKAARHAALLQELRQSGKV